MGFALFHYTLFVMLGSVLASATCLSSYLVSRKRLMLFSFFGFLFYFFDVAWVFQGDFFTEDTVGLGGGVRPRCVARSYSERRRFPPVVLVDSVRLVG